MSGLESIEDEIFSVLNETVAEDRDISFNKKMMKLCQHWVTEARTVRVR